MTHRYSSYFLIYTLLVFLTVPPLCQAGETDDGATGPTILEDITITDRPIIQGNQTDIYGSTKTVITQEQINDLNAQDLETALKMTPGVSMSRYNPIGSFGGADGGGVFIRGMGSSRPGAEIKTVVDGVPMFMSVWNHPLLDLMSIDSSQAIEVYKSPQPQYFGNAVGLINIVPKRLTEPGFFTCAEAAVGSYGTHIAKTEHGGNINGWDYYLGGALRESNGHRDHAEGELKNIYGRIGRQLSDHWNLSIFAMANDNWANDPGGEGADPSERLGRYETRVWMGTATLSHEYETAKGEIKLYRSAGEGDWLDQPTNTAGVTEDLFNDFLFYGVRVKETLALGNGMSLLAGADWDYTEGDYTQEYSDGTSDEWDGENFDILAPYAAFSWQIGVGNGITITPSFGARLYSHSQYSDELAPHAGLTASFGRFEAHMGYSRGVVYPGLEVAVMSQDVLPALGDSWKDLEPETVDHYEIGFSVSPTRQTLLDLILFYEDGNDRYVIVPFANGVMPHYDNVEEFTIKGLEATATWQPDSNFSIFAGVTLLDTDPGDLPYAPDVSFSTGFSLRFLERFKLSLNASYISSMHVSSQVRKKDDDNNTTVDDFFIVDAKITYDLDLKGADYKIKLFLAGENLTDQNYEYQSGYPMPGINCMAGIRFEM
ncbi:TonB-dependent receptor domain-containing protein [uncultured Desulfobacter sp.]|uniref:TonB-dependent receptor n=1 Tax=uncultured Desulfobacter sp. TaxID=240139 RepID=UPI0029F49FDB|nr:TonB-dependent receptor [uncultured Desulfobacter sp.]